MKYDFIEIVTLPDGKIRVYGNGGLIYEANGNYITIKRL
jgi:hypothetical protein